MRTRFHAAEAKAAVQFFPDHLALIEGPKAGHAYKLSPWQADDVRLVFGTQVYSTEAKKWVRLIRTIYEEIPRKNGKSTKGAGIGLKGTFADGEPGAENFSVAEDLDQANRIFSIAARMVEASPTLSAPYKGKQRAAVFRRLIEDRKTGNVYRVIPGDAAGNLQHNPHFVIFDELRTQKSRELWDAMTTAQGTRLQPIVWAFSTAGTDRTSICREVHDYGERVRSGDIDDPTFLYIRYGIEEGESWQDEGVIRRVNPNLGHGLLWSFLKSELVKAKASPARENSYRNLYLNEWTYQLVRWISMDAWNQQANIQMLTTEGQCYGGIHATSNVDIASVCWLFPESHSVLWRFFLPAERLPSMDVVTGGQASVWVRDGHLTLTPGGTKRESAIAEQVVRDASAFEPSEVEFSPVNFEMAQGLEDEGLTMVRAPVGAQIRGANAEFERRVMAGELVHAGNPVATWMMDNAVAKMTPDGINQLDVTHSGGNVSGIAAAIYAVNRAMLPAARSAYEEHGFEVI